MSARKDHSMTVAPASAAYCFGTASVFDAEKRAPRPAAGTMAQTRRAAGTGFIPRER
jgi:hypothetical protein